MEEDRWTHLLPGSRLSFRWITNPSPLKIRISLLVCNTLLAILQYCITKYFLYLWQKLGFSFHHFKKCGAQHWGQRECREEKDLVTWKFEGFSKLWWRVSYETRFCSTSSSLVGIHVAQDCLSTYDSRFWHFSLLVWCENAQDIRLMSSPPSSKPIQGAKKVSFTACHWGKL